MDHLADSIAKLSKGRKNWYIGRESVPLDGSPGEKCEPVIVFSLCICLLAKERIRLDCLVFRTRYSGAGIATRSYVPLYIIKSLLSMRRWSKGRQYRSFNIAVTLKV